MSIPNQLSSLLMYLLKSRINVQELNLLLFFAVQYLMHYAIILPCSSQAEGIRFVILMRVVLVIFNKSSRQRY